jgi:hypothetical protein
MNRRRNYHCEVLILALLLGASVFAAPLPPKNSDTKTSKPKVAVFAKAGPEYAWSKEVAESKMEDKLTESGFTLVSRSQLDTVMSELKLTVNNLFDSKEAARLGKQAGAKFLVIAKVIDISQKNKFGVLPVGTIEVAMQIQVISCETSEILFTKTYKDRSKSKVANDPKAANTKMTIPFLEATDSILDQFLKDYSGPLNAQGSSSNSKIGQALDDPHPDTTKKPKDDKSSKLVDPKPPKSPKSKPVTTTAETPPAVDPPVTTTSTPAVPQLTGHGKVVDVDGQTIFLEISGPHVGQIIEVYTKRRSVNDEKGDLLSYYYNPTDKCARLRVTDVMSGNSVAATLEQTFAPGGAADAKPRADRVAKLNVARLIN